MEAGAKQAVADINDMLGYKGDDKIKLTYSAPDKRDNVDEQISILDEEMARYPMAIGIAAIDATACHVQFELAADNNITIVPFATEFKMNSSETPSIFATCFISSVKMPFFASLICVIFSSSIIRLNSQNNFTMFSS